VTTTTTTSRTAAIYCRISADRDGTGLGVERQERQCRELCERRGWKVARVYVDNDMSAYHGKRRPDYEAMLSAVTAGEVDAVVAYASDRLYRRLTDLVTFTNIINAAGCEVETVAAGPIDLTTASGRFSANVTGAAAQFEVEKTSERQRAKMVETAERGRPHGGRRAYGFERDGVTHRPDEVAHIRDAVEGLLSGRYGSLRQAVLALERNGARSTAGTTFKETTLRRLLTSPRLNGRREHNGLTFPASWKAIVTDDEHAQLVAMFPPRERTGTTYQTSRHLLSGLLVCGKCGCRMTFRPVKNYAAGCYACPSKPRGCNAVAISAAAVEKFVIDMASVAVNRPRAVAMPEDIKKLTREVASLEARQDTFADDYALGVLDRRAYERVTTTTRERLVALRAQIDARAAAAVQATREAAAIDTWSTLDYSERRDALRVLARRIVVNAATGGSKQGRKFDPERVRVEFNIHTGTDGEQHGPDGILDTDHALVIA
jgi:site-specific DNA recombinase